MRGSRSRGLRFGPAERLGGHILSVLAARERAVCAGSRPNRSIRSRPDSAQFGPESGPDSRSRLGRDSEKSARCLTELPTGIGGGASRVLECFSRGCGPLGGADGLKAHARVESRKGEQAMGAASVEGDVWECPPCSRWTLGVSGGQLSLWGPARSSLSRKIARPWALETRR